MTALLAGCLLLGLFGGGVAWLALEHNAYTQGCMDGRREAALTHESHPGVVEGWNDGLSDRHRSPDEQRVTREPAYRPDWTVLHHP